MSKDGSAGVFKPVQSKGAAKQDATTAAAWDIINGELAAREAKTARLRAERLAQEAAAGPVEAPRKRTTRRAT